ncbi:hypothetical protein CN613_25625 [Bacillus pseudomycoides]|uniref:Uncharacterized protein n=1 Tax=Bacillus pseudomycoides TaxID=64104 RepID=A0A2A8BYI5_9BACI|nr:hypothetical protein [Bacillus pseudomycoides]PEM65326.1 hypothetical protein CN613_25625 [Bacillus pseudomycoides]
MGYIDACRQIHETQSYLGNMILSKLYKYEEAADVSNINDLYKFTKRCLETFPEDAEMKQIKPWVDLAFEQTIKRLERKHGKRKLYGTTKKTNERPSLSVVR